MPCYLFTYHAYGSWMPDRARGCVDRIHGLLPQDKEMGKAYRQAMQDEQATFEEEQQLVVINSLIEGITHIDCDLHAVATDPTHAHALVSWKNPTRTWIQNRTSLKRSITITLQKECYRRQWLAGGASRKRVNDRQHFDHLRDIYLPSHRGWKWDERRGSFR
jgi:hypothetical protein